MYLADESLADRALQSSAAIQLHSVLASDLEAAQSSGPIPKVEPKVKRIKTQQPRFLSPLCHITASSSCEDLLIIPAPTSTDKTLLALVDSGATKDFISDLYVRDQLLVTHPLKQPLRIRLADGSMSMARYGTVLSFSIGTLQISREFVVTRLSGSHQIILGLGAKRRRSHRAFLRGAPRRTPLPK